MLNLLHTKTFLTVIGEGGFRAAARELKVSPSTIIEHINQLEEDLAAILIVRRRGAVETTPHGAAFVPLARAMLETAARSRTLIANAPLRIAASSNIGTYLLQPQLASFQANDPCPTDLWIGANAAVAERLATGNADVALMEWWDERPGFSAQTWRKEKLVVIVAPEHPFAKRAEIEAAELATQSLLGGETGTGTMTLLKAKLGRVSGQFKAVGGFGSTEAVKRAVRAGRGLSIVMAATVVDEVAAGQLVALPLKAIDLAKELKIITPLYLPSAAPAARFVARAMEGAGP
ncbi:LysR family transcriptional regulator [Pseudorhodoplanes sinuspersici]|nr:LysR family transcriptional regulator [Pseudorhodoplanes sinuspersici]RKE73505.1 DNA-binding transcriptional LysR family regulator [Pseudorhodoplanes sinuspersici]